MKSPPEPSSRRLGRAGMVIACIILAMFVIVFVGRNFWHGEELQQDEASGNNVATEHSGPSYNQQP